MPEPAVTKPKSFAREWAMKLAVLLGFAVILGSPGWGWGVYNTVKSVGENSEAIIALTETVTELTATLGGMGQLFGNAEILDVGDTMTAAYNTHSDAVRFKPGQRLVVTNTGDRREMSVTLVIEGKFESEPHIFLNLSKNAGRALGATPGDTIQVAIEPVK